jgi:hypothetical protein
VFIGDNGSGVFRFCGAGFAFFDGRTTAIAFSTNVRAADRAVADELMIASPKQIATNKITRSELRFLEMNWTHVEVESDVMGALLRLIQS